MPRFGEKFTFELTWQQQLGIESVGARKEEPMKVAIDVKNRGEADALRSGLGDPTTRAFVLTVGLLLPLPPRARKRVLEFVSDKFDEVAADEAQPSLLK